MNWYLPRVESEWLKSQEKGFLLQIVRKQMAGGEPPSEEPVEFWTDAVPFTAVKPPLLTGSELFHPKP